MKSLSVVVLAAALATLAGCAAESNSDSSATSSSADVTSAAPVQLVGAYHGATGSSSGPALEGIVFNANGTFFADVTKAAHCWTPSCANATVRVTGTYKLSGNTVTLSGSSDTDSAFYGTYDVTVGSNGTITLAQGTTSSSLEQDASYCAAAVDCDSQGLIHPDCAPSAWSCTEQHTCQFSCGK